MSKRKRDRFSDFGLGSKASSGNYRALNKDGSFNVRKTNLPFYERFNFFHSLISMSWLRFLATVLLCYFLVNILFASIYMSIGLHNLTGIDGDTEFDKFMEAFFFSAQTITTLGYGRVAPMGIHANIVAATESMLGLLSFALATGMVYGRFSKPSAKIKYSSIAVMAPYKDINGFMFRVINPQKNQLLEVEVNATVSIKRVNSDLRDFHLLDLERPQVIFFPSTWTIVHPITDSSPLHNLSDEDFHERDVEFIILIKAFDESFSQTVYSRTSYKADEIKWGQKFVYMINQSDGGITVDVAKIDETEKADLNA